ncbi:MAG: EAL domain-containing protein [Lachnoclostridium sp.]|nr:EAL domain-containing protein [Lachnoclostridium sp.]
MKQDYFEWRKFSSDSGNLLFPVDAMEDIFLIDIQNNRIWLSEKCSKLLFDGQEEYPTFIDQNQFEVLLSDVGAHAFRQAIQRLMTRKVERVSCHVALQGKTRYLSSVMHLYRLEGREELFGYISVDYEPMREYEQHLEQVIQQLKHTQLINELTLEGASDYVYQLDLLTNTCTFSTKALDVLPLETPTFSDAMNRVLSFIIPEDRHIFLDSFTPFLTGQSDRHIAEYRVMTKQGNIMWISCKGKGLHDEQGRPIMIAGSLLDITERKKNEERMEKMLYFDDLTGLKNRRCFERDMEERLANGGTEGSILYMNIRRFKLYNELFGHDFGNKVLIEFADMLRLYFAGEIGIYRFSGDEFVVHLQECDRNVILGKLSLFQAVLKRTRTIDGHGVYINTYIATVIYPEHGNTTEELLNNAHQCLYNMTRAERDEISFFSGNGGDTVSKQFLIENELRKDIENDFRHFRTVYQPIVRLTNEGIEWIGAEALVRYSNPALPELNQMDMIHILEYSGLIIPVGRWVISQAIHECSKWNKSGKKSIVHVNIAAQQVSDVGLIRFIHDKCEEEGLPAGHLVAELTETSLLNNFEVATTFSRELLKMGTGVALDDFGTGYSGFNYLRELPITHIKIDRSYVRNLQNDKYNQTFISFMSQLTKDLKMEICIEGVESEAEVELLRQMGVSVIQGYYFDQPMEADMILREFLSQKKMV